MQAVILAAGMGKRLKDLTQDNTKCMVKVNGVSLIDRMLHQLEGLNLSKIVIVIGYEGKKLIDYIDSLGIVTPIIYVNNPIYDKTNNIYSLSLAKEFLCQEDTLLFESDIIFEDSVVRALLDDPRETLALVDKYESWMDGTCVTLTEDDSIDSFVPGSKFSFSDIDSYYKTVNIYKFSRDFSKTHYVPFLTAYEEALGYNEYYEQVLRVITMLDNPGIFAKRLNGEKWYEIDDIQDLDIAESIFANEESERAELIQNRYGGYWRYPHTIDFSYLSMPFFPPQKMLDELKASFNSLVTGLPSGMRVNALLAAKIFGLKQEMMVVGNGVTELIKPILDEFSGRLGIVCPSYKEYAKRYRGGKIVEFWPQNDDFRYNATDVINYFEVNKVDNLILINPDNPSGNYLSKSDIQRILAWTKENEIRIILDETGIDYVDEADATLLNTEMLENNKHLYVMKGVSDSSGISGIRLGVLCTADIETINKIKDDVSIWNINSFAEFYMQIFEKYRKKYNEAIEKFRKEREYLRSEIDNIKGLRAIKTQSNYIMVELTDDLESKELSKRLIIDYDILIKNLDEKISSPNKQYIRVSVRNREDNNKLIKALKEIKND